MQTQELGQSATHEALHHSLLSNLTWYSPDILDEASEEEQRDMPTFEVMFVVTDTPEAGDGPPVPTLDNTQLQVKQHKPLDRRDGESNADFAFRTEQTGKRELGQFALHLERKGMQSWWITKQLGRDTDGKPYADANAYLDALDEADVAWDRGQRAFHLRSLQEHVAQSGEDAQHRHANNVAEENVSRVERPFFIPRGRNLKLLGAGGTVFVTALACAFASEAVPEQQDTVQLLTENRANASIASDGWEEAIPVSGMDGVTLQFIRKERLPKLSSGSQELVTVSPMVGSDTLEHLQYSATWAEYGIQGTLDRVVMPLLVEYNAETDQVRTWGLLLDGERSDSTHREFSMMLIEDGELVATNNRIVVESNDGQNTIQLLDAVSGTNASLVATPTQEVPSPSPTDVPAPFVDSIIGILTGATTANAQAASVETLNATIPSQQEDQEDQEDASPQQEESGNGVETGVFNGEIKLAAWPNDLPFELSPEEHAFCYATPDEVPEQPLTNDQGEDVTTGFLYEEDVSYTNGNTARRAFFAAKFMGLFEVPADFDEAVIACVQIQTPGGDMAIVPLYVRDVGGIRVQHFEVVSNNVDDIEIDGAELPEQIQRLRSLSAGQDMVIAIIYDSSDENISTTQKLNLQRLVDMLTGVRNSVSTISMERPSIGIGFPQSE